MERVTDIKSACYWLLECLCVDVLPMACSSISCDYTCIPKMKIVTYSMYMDILGVYQKTILPLFASVLLFRQCLIQFLTYAFYACSISLTGKTPLFIIIVPVVLAIAVLVLLLDIVIALMYKKGIHMHKPHFSHKNLIVPTPYVIH